MVRIDFLLQSNAVTYRVLQLSLAFHLSFPGYEDQEEQVQAVVLVEGYFDLVVAMTPCLC